MIAKRMGYIFCLFVVLIVSGCASLSVLEHGALKGDLDKVKKALAEGADINQKNTRLGTTPLHWAAVGEHLETMKYLISHGADITQKDGWGRTALHHAAFWSEGNLEVVQYLLSVGADPNIKDNNGNNAQKHARRHEIAAFLDDYETSMTFGHKEG